MSNMYCVYLENRYKAKMRNRKIIITAKNWQEGFENYVDVLGNEHEDLFMKEVNFDELELVYKETIEICYEGTYFQLLSSIITPINIENNEFILCTDSEKVAQQYGFDKKEQFVFVKSITKEQIESIKIIQKPIKEFDAYGIKEIVIEKKEIDTYLLAI